MRLLTRSDDLGKVHTAPEKTQMLHNTLGMVLRKSNTKLGEQSHVLLYVLANV